MSAVRSNYFLSERGISYICFCQFLSWGKPDCKGFDLWQTLMFCNVQNITRHLLAGGRAVDKLIG